MSDETVKTEGMEVTGEKTPANAEEVIAAVKEPITHKIVVDEKEREVSLEELKDLAQKGASSEARFRAASALDKENESNKKAADHHRQMMEVVQLAKTPGPKQAEALRAMAANYPEFGITKEDAETVISHIAEEEQGESAKTKAEAKEGPPTFEEMPERVQKSVIDAESRTRDSNLTTVRKTLADALDKDEVLSTILIGKRKESRSKRLTDIAFAILSRTVTQAGRYTPDAVRAAVEETRQFATDVGLLDVDDSVPGSPLGLGRGPTASFGQVRTPGSPPPQISPKDALDTEKYARNVLDRLEYESLKNAE